MLMILHIMAALAIEIDVQKKVDEEKQYSEKTFIVIVARRSTVQVVICKVETLG